MIVTSLFVDAVSGHPIAARLTASDSRKLYIYMHEMQNFVKVMQGYVSTQVGEYFHAYVNGFSFSGHVVVLR